MPRELRARRQRHGLSCAGSSADPAHTLSVRLPAPAQTLASVATQGRCGGAEQQAVAVGVVVRKGCLKRLGAVARGGVSGAAKKVSFASEPQVRVMSPLAVVEAMGRRRGRETLPGAEVGGGESRRPRGVRFGGGSSVLAGPAAPVRRSMRNAVNLGVGVEPVTVVVCKFAKSEEEGDAGETVDRKRKRKSRKNSEHMVVSARIGISPRSTRSSDLLSEAPFVWPPVVKKKRAWSKGTYVKDQTLEEQTAEVHHLGSTLNSEIVTIGNALPMVVESKRNKRNVEEDEPAEQKAATEETSGRIRRTTRSSSIAAAVVSPVVVENIETRKTEGAHSDGELPKVLEAPVKDAPVLGGLRSRAVQGQNSELGDNHFVKKLEDRRQPTKSSPHSNSYQELTSSVEEKYQEQIVALCKTPPLRRSRRKYSEASGLLLNNKTSSESNSCTGAREEGKEVKIACLTTHNAAKDDTKEGMPKEDKHLELQWHGGSKDCAGTKEQMVQVVVRKGCLKRSGADVSSGSSGVAKKVTFKLVEQAGADVRRPRVVADGEGDAGEAGSSALLKWSRRNAVNFGAADGVEKIAGAASQNISAKADVEEEDVGEEVDRKPNASENVEDIKYVWLMPNIATTNLSQMVAATKSAANKMATKVVANFGKKLSLYHVDHGANKVGQAAVVAMDQIDA